MSSIVAPNVGTNPIPVPSTTQNLNPVLGPSQWSWSNCQPVCLAPPNPNSAHQLQLSQGVFLMPEYPKPKGRHINQEVNPGLRVRLSFDFHAATNIRYNSVKRNSHKALLPYGNKLKGLGRYISQDLEGYISLYTATPHGQINRGHISLGLPPQMATAGKGTPATGCCPK